MQFESYSPDRLMIDSIVSRLTPEENSFRRWLMDYSIANKKPFNVKRDYPAQLEGSDTKKLAESLITKKVVASSDNGDLNFIYPLSLVPTSHQVFLEDGRTLFAMCAVDALGTSLTFGQNIRIRSKCSECDKPVNIRVQDGCITTYEPEETRVLHVDLNKFENWACGA